MNQEEIIELFKTLPKQHYKKFGLFSFRIVSKEELVETWIGDELETRNTAFPGDVIMTGPNGEEFVLKPEKFKQRYQIKFFVPSDAFKSAGVAEAIGEGYAAIWEGDPITFTTAWGEEMICNAGDFLYSPNEEVTEVYRIEAEIFNETYKKD